MVSAWRKEKVL